MPRPLISIIDTGSESVTDEELASSSSFSTAQPPLQDKSEGEYVPSTSTSWILTRQVEHICKVHVPDVLTYPGPGMAERQGVEKEVAEFYVIVSFERKGGLIE